MCDYCKKYDSKVVFGKTFDLFGEKNQCALYIQEGEERKLNVHIGNATIFSKKIKYCFMCGRKL